MSSYTPGPWIVREVHPGRSNTPVLQVAIGGPGTPAIAEIIRGTRPFGERAANAHLIATAPDLLEVARLGYHLSTYAACCNDARDRNTADWVTELRRLIEDFQPIAEAAIAKALGSVEREKS